MSAPQKPLAMGAREWMLLLALSALWGGSFFFFKVLVAELPPLTVVLGRVGLAAVLLNVFLLLRRDPMPTSPRLWGALAYMIYFRILAVAGATNLMLVTFLLPLSALFLGVVFLGETLTLQAIGGMALIGLGLVGIDGRLWPAVRPFPVSSASKHASRATPRDNYDS